RNDALRFRRVLGPHDGAPAAGQRQDGERPSRQEMLLGAAVMVALVRHRGDDGGLVIGPAKGFDAGQLAQPRPPPVRRHDRPRPSPTTSRDATVAPSARLVAAWSRCVSQAVTAVGRKMTPSSRALATRAVTRSRFSIMWANGSPGVISPSKVRNTGRAASP